ncbi:MULTISPECIES: DUF3307 domain-containing protein [Methylobacterium]|jgi:hypothetical protein|uniref:Protein of unassigned function n=2 Tax=Methylobacterium TaxID=407 RepID=A0A089NNI2_9HYPH|nr:MULTISPECIES: DUF3307 domain-containing protein [Methylobacterium]KOX50221.1 hypothetical protein ADL19_19345 [Streptomyces purpurogeneiscleroticus]AIQ89456.1 protein of unassigned function [Methylobacterium oryzae CBMB20]AWV18214.1 hypothetical protein A3862_24105 [Methylobacterium sp. XJLW]MBA9065400.1 hypothetical protein [Methylobacterium fujisawaense]MBP28499.1 DUF3307 domain-containing protein [Methylobacterium sp.]
MPSVDTLVPVGAFALLVLAFAVKHLAADFLFQTNWMAEGKQRPSAWLVPLCAHTGLHGLGTLLIALAVKPALWWLALADFAIHTAIDRGKALVAQRTRLPTTDARFWWLVGIDQFLHQVTHLGFAVMLAAA